MGSTWRCASSGGLFAIACSTYGASCSAFRRARASCRSSKPGCTRPANSSSDEQMSSWRSLPPCWMKMIGSTRYFASAGSMKATVSASLKSRCSSPSPHGRGIRCS